MPTTVSLLECSVLEWSITTSTVPDSDPVLLITGWIVSVCELQTPQLNSFTFALMHHRNAFFFPFTSSAASASHSASCTAPDKLCNFVDDTNTEELLVHNTLVRVLPLGHYRCKKSFSDGTQWQQIHGQYFFSWLTRLKSFWLDIWLFMWTLNDSDST